MIPSDRIRIPRVGMGSSEWLDPEGPAWHRAAGTRIALQPAPVAMAAGVSTYLAQSRGHGRVRELRVQGLHDGRSIAIRLAWVDPTRNDRIGDLDQFVDAAAVMFPLAPEAELLTMGSASAPVNIWFWKADRSEPFDVVAHGYSTSRRRPAAMSGLEARSRHAKAEWSLVFRRPLAGTAAGTVSLEPSAATRLGFAVWDGANSERAGQKSVSMRFIPLALAP